VISLAKRGLGEAVSEHLLQGRPSANGPSRALEADLSLAETLDHLAVEPRNVDGHAEARERRPPFASVFIPMSGLGSTNRGCTRSTLLAPVRSAANIASYAPTVR
jgi:hypothetical protein